MKNLVYTLFFFLAVSCQMTPKKMGAESKVDTVRISEKRYGNEIGEANPDYLDYLLVKEQKGDSLLSFFYYQDTILKKKFDFDIKGGEFNLIQESGTSKFVPVDTFSIQIKNEELVVYKYEELMPAIDGEKGLLFNQYYGLIGYAAYSWGTKSFLADWDGSKIEKEMERALLGDTVRYLKRSKPDPSSTTKQLEMIQEAIDHDFEEN